MLWMFFFYKEQNFEEYAYIKSIDVAYNGFDNLQIIVVEKDVINFIEYQNAYLALDKDGYVIDYLSEVDQAIPLVEGLYFETASLGGQKLPVEETIVKALLELHHLRSKYSVPLTSINFPFSDGTMLHVYVNNIQIVMGDLENLDIKMKNAGGEVMKKLSTDLSGTLDLQEDKDQFIFKKNQD